MRFAYLRDPLFLAAVLVYAVNRFVLKAVWDSGFIHAHLNDLLCIPVWVPIMVWGMRKAGVRSDGPPDAAEVVIPLLVWSWLFELGLPRTDLFGPLCVADHQDILWYSIGALGAAVFWRWWYGPNRGTTAALPAEVNNR